MVSTIGCSGAGHGVLLGDPHDPLPEPLGGFQCRAPQAESEVIVLDATSKGAWGSRGGSTIGVQRCERGHRRARISEDWPVLGRQRGHLLDGRRGRQRSHIRVLELAGPLDRRVLRSVLPGRHAVIVDAPTTADLAMNGRIRSTAGISVGDPHGNG